MSNQVNPFIQPEFIKTIHEIFDIINGEDPQIAKERYVPFFLMLEKYLDSQITIYQKMYDDSPRRYSLDFNYLDCTYAGYLWELADVVCYMSSVGYRTP